MDIRRIASIKRDGQVQGNRVRVKVVKNKVAAPFREAEFDIAFGKGFSREGDVLDLGVEKEIINKAGTWFSYGETRLGQGREAVKEYLAENTKLLEKIESEVRKAYGLNATPSKINADKKVKEPLVKTPKAKKSRGASRK
jgi:recombination protein RecA